MPQLSKNEILAAYDPDDFDGMNLRDRRTSSKAKGRGPMSIAEDVIRTAFKAGGKTPEILQAAADKRRKNLALRQAVMGMTRNGGGLTQTATAGGEGR